MPVVQKETYHVNSRVAHPAGSVGVIVRSPIDRSHTYRVKFNDGFEAAVHHDQLVRLSEELLAMREAFLSKLVFQTYSGYVASQFKKMQTDIRNQGRVLLVGAQGSDLLG